MGIARDVRDDIHRLIDMLPPGDLAKLARAAERLRRRRERRARLEWVSEFVHRLPAGERPDAWTALLWLVGEKPVEATAGERRALAGDGGKALPWEEAKSRLGL